MRRSRLLSPDRIELNARVDDSADLLRRLATLLSDAAIPAEAIQMALSRREASGSTALGDGVAIPHARLPTLEAPRAAFLRSERPIAFDAPDGAPVDLFFAFLVPAHATSEHLSILAGIAECFSDEPTRLALRRAPQVAQILERLGESLREAAA